MLQKVDILIRNKWYQYFNTFCPTAITRVGTGQWHFLPAQRVTLLLYSSTYMMWQH